MDKNSREEEGHFTSHISERLCSNVEKTKHSKSQFLSGDNKDTYKAGLRETLFNNTRDLIPGLPDDIAQLCLVKVAREALPKLGFVCKAWKQLCESTYFHYLRSQVGSAEAWLYVLAERPIGAPFKAFNPQLNKWYELPPIPGSEEGLCWQGFACVAVGSNLLLMGGMHSKSSDIRGYSSGVVSGEVKVYDVYSNRWSTAASMNIPRSWFAAAAIGDFVYVAGGQGKNCFLNSVEVYDSKLNVWSCLPNMINVRSSCYGLALNGKFWVVGGEYMRNQYENRPKRGSAEVYDPETGMWSLVPEMWLDSHKVPGPNTVYNGKLLFVHQSKLMMYDEETNSWCHVGDLSGDVYNRQSSRFGFACESINDDLYIVGGRRISKQSRYTTQFLNTTEVCKLFSEGPFKVTPWQNAADMGNCEGNVLASAVLWL